MTFEKTKYYDEFIYYFNLAKKQQELCNIGSHSYENSVEDDLMTHIHLYDVVERKYAGFSQIVNDVFYGLSDEHPYSEKIKSGKALPVRIEIAKNWNGKRNHFSLADWLFVFILHRVTGSGINYAYNPSGYYNTILPVLYQADTIEDMCDIIMSYDKSFYTSVGYQFPAFPKIPENLQYKKSTKKYFSGLFDELPSLESESGYKRAGDYYLCEFAPRLSRDLEAFLLKNGPKTFREIGSFMLNWNSENGLRQYKFQYAAVLADIADWFPELVQRDSLFYYGSNARECIGYLAKKTSKQSSPDQLLDSVMLQVFHDTGSVPYNAEDVACDFIRWIENYANPAYDYSHVDLDSVWNSSSIKDHPYGRQRAMIDLGLIPTFKGLKKHPSDDYVLKQCNVSEQDYQEMIKKYYQSI